MHRDPRLSRRARRRVFKEQTSSIDGRIGWGVHQTKSKRQMLKEEKVRFANAKRLLRKHKLKAELVDPGSDDEDDDYFATCVVVDAEGNVLDKTFDWRLESGLWTSRCLSASPAITAYQET